MTSSFGDGTRGHLPLIDDLKLEVFVMGFQIHSSGKFPHSFTEEGKKKKKRVACLLYFYSMRHNAVVGEKILVFLQLYVITSSSPEQCFILCNVHPMMKSVVVTFMNCDNILLGKNVSNFKLPSNAFLELQM